MHERDLNDKIKPRKPHPHATKLGDAVPGQHVKVWWVTGYATLDISWQIKTTTFVRVVGWSDPSHPWRAPYPMPADTPCVPVENSSSY
jgi:hypothetical protein